MYGLDAVVYEVLEQANDMTKEEMNVLEIHYIKAYQSANPDKGYNRTLGGIGMLGYKQSEETVAKRIRNQHGEGNSQAKLTNKEFFEIVDLLKQGMTNKEIADRYGLHANYISLIRHKRRFLKLWEQVTDYTPTESTGKINFSYEKFLLIQDRLNSGATNASIEKEFDLSSGTASRLRHKKLYKDYWKRYENEMHTQENVQRPSKGQ